MDDYVFKTDKPIELRTAIDRLTSTATKVLSAKNSAPNSARAGDVVDLVEALAQIEGNRDPLHEIVEMFLKPNPTIRSRGSEAAAATKIDKIKAPRGNHWGIAPSMGYVALTSRRV